MKKTYHQNVVEALAGETAKLAPNGNVVDIKLARIAKLMQNAHRSS